MKLSEFIARKDQFKGDFVRVTVSTNEAAKTLRRLEHEFRSFHVIITRTNQVEQRAEVHGGMGRDELLRAYVAARPHGVEGVDDDACVQAGVALAGEE